MVKLNNMELMSEDGYYKQTYNQQLIEKEIS